MSEHFHVPYNDLPKILPLFPIFGVIVLPGGSLPMDVFEPRYINMILDALGRGRMFGIIQPQEPASVDPDQSLYRVGTVVRITRFEESEEGRLSLLLKGVCRFNVKAEMPTLRGYRQVEADYSDFKNDFFPKKPSVDRCQLLSLLKTYLTHQEVDLEPSLLTRLSDRVLMSSLAMALPFESSEKQALLEAPSLAQRYEVMSTLLRIGARGFQGPEEH